MTTKTQSTRISFLLIALFFLGAVSPIHALDQEDLDKRMEKVIGSFNDLMMESHSRIPESVLDSARGVLILRQYEAGFIFGGKGGYGVAIMKNGMLNRWDTPAWYKTGEGSWGLQLGVQKLNVVFVIMTEEGENLLRQSKFRIGVDAAAAVGPVGGNTEFKVGKDTPPILVYAATEGLYAGATFEAGWLVVDNEANMVYYGKDVTAGEVLDGDVKAPASADRLIETLKRYH